MSQPRTLQQILERQVSEIWMAANNGSCHGDTYYAESIHTALHDAGYVIVRACGIGD